MTVATTAGLLGEISDIGRDATRGGYSRHGFTSVEAALREWFVDQAQRRDLQVRIDRNGNLWAWWGRPGPNAVVTGSHWDSVPGGGAFDGPLGVVSALVALDRLRAVGGVTRRPVGIVVFAEEEGGRFGVPCLGSRLLTGSLDPDAARRLTDPDGITLAEAVAAAGLDPARLGPDPALADIGCFIELHVEQGRLLDRLPARPPVAIGSSIVAHGRWRFTLTGVGNHAGSTELDDRHDPMLPAAEAVLAARAVASNHPGGARATVGRLIPVPGATNAIPSSVELWLDARAQTPAQVTAVVADIEAATRVAAAAEGCALSVREESFGPTVCFDATLRDRLVAVLESPDAPVPVLPTNAGHDAGVLAARVPTAMLFVRNPTGISHAPEEFAEPGDCERGADALATVLGELCR